MHIPSLAAVAAFSAAATTTSTNDWKSSASAMESQIASAMSACSGSSAPDMSALHDSMAKMMGGASCGAAPDASNMQAYMYMQVMQLSMKIAAMEMASGHQAGAMADMCAASAMAMGPMQGCQPACSSSFPSISRVPPPPGTTTGNAPPPPGTTGNAPPPPGTTGNAPPPYTSVATTPVQPVTTTHAPPPVSSAGNCCSGSSSNLGSCESACKKSYSACQTAPNANEAQCAADYASCLGYSPFPYGSAGTVQTGCAASMTTTATAPPATSSAASCCSGSSEKLASCEASCKKSYSDCQTAPNANQAQCAAEYSACLGYVPFPSGTAGVVQTGCASTATCVPSSMTSTAPVKPTSTGGSCCSLAPSEQASCYKTCEKKYSECQTKPNANQAECASEYAGCLGYNPYGTDAAGKSQTACAASSTTSTAPITTPTGGSCCSLAPSEQASCYKTCEKKYSECQTKPNANQAECASEYAGCLGYNPYGTDAAGKSQTACAASSTTSTAPITTPTGGSCCSLAPSEQANCYSTCEKKHSACQTKPNANQAECASEYAGCLGYNPYGTDASGKSQTACPASASSTKTSTAPTTTPTGASCCSLVPSQQAACETTCEKKHSACQTAPNTNEAECAAEYAGCLGYNPYGTGAQTTCSAPASSTTTATPSGDCAAKRSKCQTQPNANEAQCAAEYAACEGGKASSTTSQAVPSSYKASTMSTSMTKATLAPYSTGAASTSETWTRGAGSSWNTMGGW